MPKHNFTLVVLVTAAILPTPHALAHQFEMPEQVQADGAGRFVFEATVVLTAPVGFLYYQVDGSDNTSIASMVADGFCTATREPGTYTTKFEGHLLDPTLNGSVGLIDAYCDGWSGEGTTQILAPAVEVEARSFSAVKALYRSK